MTDIDILGGLAAATSLRKAGHKVTVYERAHYAGEVGASISCAANGTRWLEDWNVDIKIGRPVVLRKLILHNWEDGEVQNVCLKTSPAYRKSESNTYTGIRSCRLQRKMGLRLQHVSQS